MEKRKVILGIILLVWVIALAFTFYYLYGVYNDITTPSKISSKLDSRNVGLYTVSPIGPDQLTAGENLDVNKGDVIPITVQNEVYTIHVFDITDTKIDFIINNFLYFSINNPGQQKIDLNNDGYYDLILNVDSISGNKASIAVKSTYEKRSVNDNLNEVLANVKENSNLQSKIVILVILVFMIIFIVYFLINYLYPAMRLKRLTAKEKPTDTLDYFLIEFDSAKKAGDKSKSIRLATKAKSLYNHLSENEKERFKSRIKSMERYIN